jgi:hypothetical protein
MSFSLFGVVQLELNWLLYYPAVFPDLFHFNTKDADQRSSVDNANNP